MDYGGLALVAAMLLGGAAAQPREQESPGLTAVEAPSAREISRCFRGIEAGRTVRFAMSCVLDARGHPTLCQAEGVSPPQARLLEPRVNCIAAHFRFGRSDGAAVEGARVRFPLTYRPPG